MSVIDKCKNITSFNRCRQEKISRKVIGTVLEAGRNAPSPGGVQSLQFIVVENEDTKEKLDLVIGDERIEEAPTAIVVLTDRNRMARRLGKSNAKSACEAEASCAVQNMRLAAGEFGLSSCWFAGFDGKALGDKLSTPDGVIPTSVVLLGYSDNPIPMKEKFGMNEICFYDHYGNQVETFFDGRSWEGIEEEREQIVDKWNGFLDKVRRRLRKYL